MIEKNKLLEIKKFLEKSENPLFFFDDDLDGLCSYALLKKYVDKGKGIILKTTPNLSIDFLPKVVSYNPDIVFILDKPLVDQEFLDKINIPVVWIDHHNPVERKGVKYYNPRLKDKSDGSPTSYWCYKIVEENLWISMLGSIGDYFLPEFSKEFSKKYPKLIKKIDLDEIKFNSKLGKLVKICSFMLKGNISEVDNYIDYFCSIEDPNEILDKTSKKGELIHDKFDKINKIYEKYLEDGIKIASKEKLLLYEYSPNQITFNEELSNELIDKFPKKIIMIADDIEFAFGYQQNWPLGSALSIILAIVATIILLILFLNQHCLVYF